LGLTLTGLWLLLHTLHKNSISNPNIQGGEEVHACLSLPQLTPPPTQGEESRSHGGNISIQPDQ